MFSIRPHEVALVIPGGTTEDEAGTIIKELPTEIAGIPAHVDTLDGRRLEVAQRINDSTTAVIYIDHYDLPREFSVKHGEDVYTLTGPPIKQGGLDEHMALHVRRVT